MSLWVPLATHRAFPDFRAIILLAALSWLRSWLGVMLAAGGGPWVDVLACEALCGESAGRAG